MSTPYQPQMSQGLPPKKGISPWVWVLGGVAALVLLVGVSVAGLAYFAYSKVKQAGFSTEAMKKNPVATTARLMTTFNPDLEILDADEGSGKIRVRNKRDGKIFRMDFDSAKNGKLVLQEEGKDPVTIETHGDDKNNTGSISIKSEGGTVEMGSNGQVHLPSWLPAYPGAKMTGIVQKTGGDVEGGAVTITTDDSTEKVLKYYEDSLKGNGFTVDRIVTSQSPVDGEVGAMLKAEDSASKREAVVVVTREKGQTTGALQYSEKK